MKLRRILCMVFAVLACLLFPADRLFAGEAPFKTTLDNGLTVIIEENHSAPVVAFQMWVNVGAADEPREIAGISHLLEHMLFKGTEKRAVGQIAGEVEAAGGFINAYTSHDNTVYYLMVASRYFDRGLDILSDAIQHSSLDADEVAKEKEVVLEEQRMGEDNPGRMLYRRLLAAAFTTHPYGRPVIGTRETVEGMNRKKLSAFIKRWYTPENMTLVVVGDFDRAAALGAIEKSFSTFKGKKRRRKGRSPEPEQRTLRYAASSMEISETKLGIAYHIPALSHRDTYVLDILSTVMGEGRSSRLYKRLKEDERLVNTVSAFALTPKEPGSFIIRAGLEGEKVERALAGIAGVIARLGNEGVSRQELAKAKLSLESSFIYERETMNGRAGQVGYFEVVAGDMRFDREYLEGINAVTSDDVKRIVRTYLQPGNMTVTLIHPDDEAAAVDREDILSIMNNVPPARDIDDEREAPGEFSRTVLDNGITLIVKEERDNPTVAVYITMPGGLRFEERETNGLGNVTARLLSRGAGERDAMAFAEEVEGMAGAVSGFSGRNSFGLSGKFLSRYFDRGMGLVADAMLRPHFPGEEIEKVRRDVQAAIKREEENLPRFAFKLLQRELYREHPYGMPALGTEETVASFSRDDIADHYERLVIPERMVIAVVGDIGTDEARAKVTELFGSLAREGDALPVHPVEKAKKGVVRTGAARESAQVNVGIGFLGTTITSKDRYPLDVLVEILSAQSGRLFVALRDRKSLAYSVSAFTRLGVDPGFLGLYIGSAPEKRDEAVRGLLAELKKIIEEPVGNEELERAKGAIVGGYEIGLQANGAQASEVANDELFTLGYDEYLRYPAKIEGVTAEDVQRVARKYLNLKGYTISVVGPGEGE